MRVSSKRLGICLNTMQSACKDLRHYSKGVSAAGRKDVDDIYTAKGGALQVPVTAGTKSQSSLRGGGRIEGGPDGKG